MASLGTPGVEDAPSADFSTPTLTDLSGPPPVLRHPSSSSDANIGTWYATLLVDTAAPGANIPHDAGQGFANCRLIRSWEMATPLDF
jgi:hypothetical protein